MRFSLRFLLSFSLEIALFSTRLCHTVRAEIERESRETVDIPVTRSVHRASAGRSRGMPAQFQKILYSTVICATRSFSEEVDDQSGRQECHLYNTSVCLLPLNSEHCNNQLLQWDGSLISMTHPLTALLLQGTPRWTAPPWETCQFPELKACTQVPTAQPVAPFTHLNEGPK
jgi:hypothetical protein